MDSGTNVLNLERIGSPLAYTFAFKMTVRRSRRPAPGTRNLDPFNRPRA
jgi:hypothetical protein